MCANTTPGQAPRRGRQTPTASLTLPYTDTKGPDAVELYQQTGRTAQEWQALLLYDLLAVDETGLWIHSKFGYSVPRRNGKNEVVCMRELYGLEQGERILHTAHRTTTSAAASRRLARLLDEAGYTEVQRVKKDEVCERSYTYLKQLGLECITLLDTGGTVSFRTRSAKGGLGEGFDLLVIDEAQEYQDSEESALKYVVSDSANPQTVFCGTPPTPVSSGTVFLKLRNAALAGTTRNTGWAEWSVEHRTDPHDVDAWYETNPAMGAQLNERKVADEIGTDEVDFNIQRLGLWLQYNLHSAISEADWNALQCPAVPPLQGKLHIGVRYGHDGQNVALCVAVRTGDGRTFVEGIDCRPIRAGNGWIMDFLRRTKAATAAVVVDGANYQQLLADEMKDAGLKAPVLPTVKEVIAAASLFEQSGVFGHGLCHMGQPGLAQSATNCEHRAIGSGGGFGYRSIRDGVSVELLDSAVLAFWSASREKPKTKQKIFY